MKYQVFKKVDSTELLDSKLDSVSEKFTKCVFVLQENDEINEFSNVFCFMLAEDEQFSFCVLLERGGISFHSKEGGRGRCTDFLNWLMARHNKLFYCYMKDASNYWAFEEPSAAIDTSLFVSATQASGRNKKAEDELKALGAIPFKLVD